MGWGGAAWCVGVRSDLVVWAVGLGRLGWGMECIGAVVGHMLQTQGRPMTSRIDMKMNSISKKIPLIIPRSRQLGK